jgi:glucokinase
MIIAGDIGGTKTVIGLYERTTGGLHQSAERAFHSAQYKSLESMLGEFCTITVASNWRTPALVPGAIIEGKVHTTNLTWDVSEAALEAALNAASGCSMTCGNRQE